MENDHECAQSYGSTNPRDRELDLIFGALADGNRRRMVLALMTGDKTVETLRKPLGITPWGTMKHLHVLEEAGLVATEKRGRSRYCHLQVEHLKTVSNWVEEIQLFWTGNLERLMALVEEKDDSV